MQVKLGDVHSAIVQGRDPFRIEGEILLKGSLQIQKEKEHRRGCQPIEVSARNSETDKERMGAKRECAETNTLKGV